MLTLTRLRMVQAIVSHGSMRQAADALTYTPPALSQQVARLEHELGVALFERVARGVVPTVAGGRLAEIAQQVLGLVDGAELEMRKHAERRAGMLRLGSFPTGSATIVPPAIRQFVESYPDAETTLREAEPDDLLEFLRTSQIDVALVYEYALVPRELPRGLHQWHLVDDPVHLLTAQESIVPRKERVETPELEVNRWISTEVGTAGAENLERFCARYGFVPTVRCRSNDYDVIQALVGVGLGMALVPGIALRPSDSTRVLQVDADPPPRRINVVVRSSDPNPLIEPLIEVLSRVVVPDLEADNGYVRI